VIHWVCERTNFSSLEHAIKTTGTTNVVEINRCTANFINDYCIYINSGVQAMSIRTFSTEGGTDGGLRFIKLGPSGNITGSTVIDSWVGDFSGSGPFDPVVDLSLGTYHALTFQGGYWEFPGSGTAIGMKLGGGDVTVAGAHWVGQYLFDSPAASHTLTLLHNFFTNATNLFTNTNWKQHCQPFNNIGNKLMSSWYASNPANYFGNEQNGQGGLLLVGSGGNDPVSHNPFKFGLNIGGTLSGASIGGADSPAIRTAQNLTGYADGSLVVQAGVSSADVIIATGATPTKRLRVKSNGETEVAAPIVLLQVASGGSSITDAGKIYGKADSGSCEVFVMDEAGNETKVSPHDPVTGEWVFYSVNIKTGRALRVNMEQLVRAVEALTGKSFTETWTEPVTGG
jgi:hypothetical protein